MKFVVAILAACWSIVGFSECGFKKPNEVLELIKANHPRISLNTAKGFILSESIEEAKQRPNPEIDAASSVADSLSGNIYKSSVSLKHTFELGGKRGSRVKVAERSLDVGMAVAKHENENAIISSVKRLHRLRQVYELIPLYEESLNAFNKILRSIRKRKSLSPEQRVERETLELATSDYQLKISQLNAERIKLNKHLSYFIGKNCDISLSALPKEVNLTEEFKSELGYKSYSKLEAAKHSLELAHANLDLERSRSYPDLQIGPIYEYEKVGVSKTNTIGLALTMDLPILSLNSGGKARAAQEIKAASLTYKNIEKESQLDLESWIEAYKRFKASLKTIASKNELEKKHQRIEALFKRGIISTSLVIESHRQLIEFSKTRFEFEIGAANALWNIYKMNGTINKTSL